MILIPFRDITSNRLFVSTKQLWQLFPIYVGMKYNQRYQEDSPSWEFPDGSFPRGNFSRTIISDHA